MLVTIYTPKNKLFDALQAKAVYIPATNGDMQILDNHIPVITSLRSGSLFIDDVQGKRIEVAVDSGYVQFSDNAMTILIEKTSLTPEQLEAIEQKALRSKDAVIRDNEHITEEEFYNAEKSEH